MSLSKVLVLNQKTTTTTTPEARGVLADYMLILPNLVVAFFFFYCLVDTIFANGSFCFYMSNKQGIEL